MAVRRVGLAVDRYRAVAVRQGFGTGTREGLAVGSLYLEGPLTPTELAARLHSSMPAVTELLDRLEDAGHARRSRHPRDRRKVLIAITEEATAIVEAELPVLADTLEPAVRHLDPATCSIVMQSLADAAAALEGAARERTPESPRVPRSQP
jgi:DNA-binding MarR family transcriptional regulator